MSFRQKVRLNFEKEGKETELVVEFTATDIRAWEDYSGRPYPGSPTTLSQITWLGHHAGVRRELINGSLKEWAAFDQVCFDVGTVRDEKPDPTKRGGKKAATPKAATDAPSST